MNKRRWIIKAKSSKPRADDDTPPPMNRIGYGTEIEGQYGPVILCTIYAIPLGWDGELMLALSSTERKA